MIDAIKSIACAAWSFIKRSAADESKESAAKLYHSARKSIDLQQLTKERSVRDTILRAAPSLSKQGEKELQGFIKTLYKIKDMLPGEDCEVMPLTREKSAVLCVNENFEIQIAPLQTGDKDSEQLSWSATLRRPTFVDICVEVCPKAFNNAGIFHDPSVVLSPAGLVPYINTWIHSIGEKHSSTKLSFSQVEDSFRSLPARKLQEKRRWLLQNSVGHLDARLEDWSYSEIILEASPSDLSAIIHKHLREGHEKTQQLDDYIAKGLYEISTYPPEVFADALMKPTKAREFVENLEILKRYIASSATSEECSMNSSEGYSIKDRLNVTPVPSSPLCDNFIKVIDWHSTHLSSILGNNQFDNRNHFRVFAQLAGSPIPDVVIRNNVTWAKNEIISLLDRMEDDWMAGAAEAGLDCLGAKIGYVVDSLEETCRMSNLENLNIEQDDSPQDYCIKIIEATASSIYGHYLAETATLSSLMEAITGQKTPEHSALECC